MSNRYAIVTIEKHDGTSEVFRTDDNENYGITGIGYSFRYENGRQMIVHPNSVYRLIIEDKQED